MRLYILLKAQAQLGLFSSATKGRVKQHQRVSKKTGKATQVVEHQRKKRPAKPKPEPVARPESDDRSGRKRFHDAGEKIEGARKHTFDRVHRDNLEELEGLGQVKAHRTVTKAKVIGPFDAVKQRSLGDTAGAAYAKQQLLKMIDAKPSNSVGDRLAYVEGLDWLAHQLDGIHTVSELKEWVEDWKLMAQGKVTGKPMSSTDLVAELGLSDDDIDPDAYSYSGGIYVDHPSGETEEEHVKAWVYQGKTLREAHTNIRPKKAKITYDALRRAGYSEIRRLYSGDGEPTQYRLVKKDDAMRATYRGYADAMGARFTKGVVRLTRSKSVPAFHGKVLPKAGTIERADDWSWADKKASTGKGKSTRWKRHVGKEVKRRGPEITGKVDEARMLGDFHLRAVQFGNWVNDEDARANLKNCHAALTDLAEIIGIPTQAIAHGNRLGLAFGARGSGNASAHYEGSQLAINLTKTKGGGSLAHEWGHFMDHVLTGTVRGVGDVELKQDGNRLRVHFLSHYEGHPAVPPKVAEAVRNVMASIKHGDPKMVDIATEEAALKADWDEWGARVSKFNVAPRPKTPAERDKFAADRKAIVRARDELKRRQKDLSGKRAGKSDYTRHAEALGDYWGRPHEMFARAFESFVEDELANAGRENTYLVTGTQKQYSVQRANIKTPLEPYPQGAERARINKAMRAFCDALAETSALRKALDAIAVQSAQREQQRSGATGWVPLNKGRPGLVLVPSKSNPQIKRWQRQGGPAPSQQRRRAARPDARAARRTRQEQPAAKPQAHAGASATGKVHDEPMPKLPEGFNDMSKRERAKLTSDWGQVQKEMDARYERPTIGSAADGTAYLEKMAKDGWISPHNVEWGTVCFESLGRQLEAAGASPEDTTELMSMAAQKLIHQEHESVRRTLGDHGLRHIGRNIMQMDSILDALDEGGLAAEPAERAAAVLAMITHDMGYTIPAIARGGFDVKDNYHPNASMELWRTEVGESHALQRVLGSTLTNKAAGWIVSHSSSHIDWERDGVGTAIRLADNTHLFADKMPEVLYNQPQAAELMAKIAIAKKEGVAIDGLKAQLVAHIERRTDIGEPQKSALRQAAGEISKRTPKFLASRLAGRDAKFSFDRASLTMNVDVERSPLREAIGQTFGADAKDKQFIKMLGDFGVKAESVEDRTRLEGDRGAIELAWVDSKPPPNDMEKSYADALGRVQKQWGRISQRGKKGRDTYRFFHVLKKGVRFTFLLDLAKAVVRNRNYEARRGLRPPGTGWEPIPRTARRGWRKPKGKGFDYWYPQLDKKPQNVREHAVRLANDLGELLRAGWDRLEHSAKHTFAEFPAAAKALTRLAGGETLSREDKMKVLSVGITLGHVALALVSKGAAPAIAKLGQKLLTHTVVEAVSSHLTKVYLGKAGLELVGKAVDLVKAGELTAEQAKFTRGIVQAVADELVRTQRAP